MCFQLPVIVVFKTFSGGILVYNPAVYIGRNSSREEEFKTKKELLFVS
jgi:hypothetical protein